MSEIFDGFEKYISTSDDFFRSLIKSRCDEQFVNTLEERVERISRDICIQTDQHITDILKGQLSICYELIDGVERATLALEDEAKSKNAGVSPGGDEEEL